MTEYFANLMLFYNDLFCRRISISSRMRSNARGLGGRSCGTPSTSRRGTSRSTPSRAAVSVVMATESNPSTLLCVVLKSEQPPPGGQGRVRNLDRAGYVISIGKVRNRKSTHTHGRGEAGHCARREGVAKAAAQPSSRARAPLWPNGEAHSGTGHSRVQPLVTDTGRA